jgi:hypothetical protein
MSIGVVAHVLVQYEKSRATRHVVDHCISIRYTATEHKTSFRSSSAYRTILNDSNPVLAMHLRVLVVSEDMK